MKRYGLLVLVVPGIYALCAFLSVLVGHAILKATGLMNDLPSILLLARAASAVCAVIMLLFCLILLLLRCYDLSFQRLVQTDSLTMKLLGFLLTVCGCGLGVILQHGTASELKHATIASAVGVIALDIVGSRTALLMIRKFT